MKFEFLGATASPVEAGKLFLFAAPRQSKPWLNHIKPQNALGAIVACKQHASR
jgi:hypothetical protein